MGLLTKKHIARIDRLIADADGIGGGSIPIIVYFIKGKDTIWYNRIDKEAYYLTNNNLDDCFKVQTKAEFQKSFDTLEKEGWKKR